MDAVTIGNLLDVANKITVFGLLVVIIYGGKNQWWVWGWQYKQILQDANEWKQMALRLMAATQRTTAAAERTTTATEKMVKAVHAERLEPDQSQIVDQIINDMGKHSRGAEDRE